jgi:hypothetical protein
MHDIRRSRLAVPSPAACRFPFNAWIIAITSNRFRSPNCTITRTRRSDSPPREARLEPCPSAPSNDRPRPRGAGTIPGPPRPDDRPRDNSFGTLLRKPLNMGLSSILAPTSARSTGRPARPTAAGPSPSGGGEAVTPTSDRRRRDDASAGPVGGRHGGWDGPHAEFSGSSPASVSSSGMILLAPVVQVGRVGPRTVDVTGRGRRSEFGLLNLSGQAGIGPRGGL